MNKWISVLITTSKECGEQVELKSKKWFLCLLNVIKFLI